MGILGLGLNIGARAIPFLQRAIPLGIEKLVTSPAARGIGRFLSPVAKDIRTGVTRTNPGKTGRYFDDKGKDITQKIKDIIIKPEYQGRIKKGDVMTGGKVSLGYRPTVAGYGYGLALGNLALDKIIPEKQPEKLTELLKDVSPVTDTVKEDALKKEDTRILPEQLEEDEKSAIKAKAEELQETLGGDFKDQAKLQTNLSIMQIGLNMMTGKSKEEGLAKIMDIAGEASKEPVKNIQAIAYDMGEKQNQINLLAYEDVKLDQRAKEQRNFDREIIETQLNAEKQMFRDQTAISYLMNQRMIADETFAEGDPNKETFVSNRAIDFSNGPEAEALGLNKMDPNKKSTLMTEEDMNRFYELFTEADKDERQEIAQTAIENYNVDTSFLEKVLTYVHNAGGAL